MLVKPVTVSAGNIFVTHLSILVFLPSAFLNCPDQKQSLCPTYEMLGIALQILENSQISVVKPRTDNDGLLPAGRQMPADWHLTSGKFNCRTKRRAADLSATAEIEGECLRRSWNNSEGFQLVLCLLKTQTFRSRHASTSKIITQFKN